MIYKKKGKLPLLKRVNSPSKFHSIYINLATENQKLKTLIHNPKTYTMKFNLLFLAILFLFFNVTLAQQKETYSKNIEAISTQDEVQGNVKIAEIDYKKIDLILERIKNRHNKPNKRKEKNTVFKIIDTIYVEIKYSKTKSEITDF